MNNKVFFRAAFATFCIAFFMPMIASSIGMAIHGDAKGTDAGIAPLLIGIYNIPFMIIAIVALLIARSRNAKGLYQSARTSLIVSLIVCLASLVMVVPWGLMQ